MSKTITKVIAGLGIVAGLGVAALPLSSYATPHDVDVSFTVLPTIIPGSESVCTTAAQVITPGVQAGQTNTATCNIGYSANSGATVTIANKDANTSLVGAGNNANTIPALALNANQSALVPGTAGWGYKFAVTAAGAGSGGLQATAGAANYNGVPANTAPVTIGTSTSATSGAAGTITFGVQTATTTVADTYEDTVVVTITANP